MKDYIDREYAITSLDRIKKRNARNHCVLSADEDAIKKWLMALPASDVVEVVRCEDCKYADVVDDHEIWCFGRGGPMRMVPAAGFCDIGDRKDG